MISPQNTERNVQRTKSCTLYTGIYYLNSNKKGEFLYLMKQYSCVDATLCCLVEHYLMAWFPGYKAVPQQLCSQHTRTHMVTWNLSYAETTLTLTAWLWLRLHGCLIFRPDADAGAGFSFRVLWFFPQPKEERCRCQWKTWHSSYSNPWWRPSSWCQSNRSTCRDKHF